MAKTNSKFDAIKTNIRNSIEKATQNNILEVATEQFLYSLEEAIKIDGEKGKESIIRSQEPIKLFHEVVKSELIKNNVTPTSIYPQQFNSNGELKLFGFVKAKNQDVSTIPLGLQPISEIISSGLTKGQTDNYGISYTEQTLAINVRSQMSSIAKNIDTIFERTFAETLNLHMRCPKMVLGELFILPVTGFDMNEVKKNRARFESIKPVSKKGKSTAQVIEEFINAFSSINRRDITKGEDFKYERVCLLIVDFKKKPIKIYQNDAELIADNLLPTNTTASLNGLGFNTFISDLLATYSTRFPTNKFK